MEIRDLLNIDLLEGLCRNSCTVDLKLSFFFGKIQFSVILEKRRGVIDIINTVLFDQF